MTQEDLKKLYDDNYEQLMSFAKNRMRMDISICHDIVMDAFIKLYRKHKNKSEIIPGLKYYLFVIVKNDCITYLRDLNKNIYYDPYIELTLEDTSHNDIRNKMIEEIVINNIIQHLQTLPPQAKKVMEYFMKGLKTAEIAEKLNISTQNVLNQKARSLLLLGKFFKEIQIFS